MELRAEARELNVPSVSLLQRLPQGDSPFGNFIHSERDPVQKMLVSVQKTRGAVEGDNPKAFLF
jgi:hypothetical protein